MPVSLSNYIKYCLGYISLTKQKTFLSQQKDSVPLTSEQLNLIELLNMNLDGSEKELVELPIFYAYNPGDVPEGSKAQYGKERRIAQKLEEIQNSHRNDPFTKQIVLHFGYFEIDLPSIFEGDENDDDSENEKAEQKELALDGPSSNSQTKRFPLFSVPVEIISDGKQLLLKILDPELQVNIGPLASILGDSYSQLVMSVGQLETDEAFVLPLEKTDALYKTWELVKDRLSRTKAEFTQKSFSLDTTVLSLASKANYFLAEDLRKLAQMSDDDVFGTAMTAWVTDEGFNEESPVPHDGELFFPFPHDKYQVRTLALINNKASIIQGPPGTGKSETISNILCHLAATGKRALFVSQKSQALKVVKDKLKRLNVSYLFGYVPNPGSEAMTDEDETDGIAPQLSRLDSYLNELALKQNPVSPPELHAVAAKHQAVVTSLKNSIEAERRVFAICEEFQSLARFNISVEDDSLFERAFNSDCWLKARSLVQSIRTCSDRVGSDESDPHKNAFDHLFRSLHSSSLQLSKPIGEIHSDVECRGYDRHSALMRRIYNSIARARLRNVRETLPREVVDYIDGLLKKDISRAEAFREIGFLNGYFLGVENHFQLLDLQSQFNALCGSCGISPNSQLSLRDISA